jgi:hypothetical protein
MKNQLLPAISSRHSILKKDLTKILVQQVIL